MRGCFFRALETARMSMSFMERRKSLFFLLRALKSLMMCTQGVTSASLTRVSWAEFCRLPSMLSAMILRMPSMGTELGSLLQTALAQVDGAAFWSAAANFSGCRTRSTSSRTILPPSPVPVRVEISSPALAATAAARGVILILPIISWRACTSRSTMRPPGPEPATQARSMPSSRASRRAAGDAIPPVPEGCTAADALVFAGLGAPASAVAEAGESDAPSTRAIVSPGSARMPSTAPTATSCLGCTIIWKSKPSAGLSTLLVILSVSTSNRSSPCLTAAPSATNHLETLPVFMVRPSFGMASSMLTAVLLRCCVLRRKAAFLPPAGADAVSGKPCRRQ